MYVVESPANVQANTGAGQNWEKLKTVSRFLTTSYRDVADQAADSAKGEYQRNR